MWFIEPAIGMPVVILLLVYLFIKHCRRITRPESSFWESSGTSADLTNLNAKMENVRRDYLAATRPTRDAGFRRALLGVTRKIVARLDYFRDKGADMPASTSREVFPHSLPDQTKPPGFSP